MRGRVFLFLLSLTTTLAIGSHPATLRMARPVSPTATSLPATATPTATVTPTRTPDPLARFPTTTPIGGGFYVPAWPAPTWTPAPTAVNLPAPTDSPPIILPDRATAAEVESLPSTPFFPPLSPTPAGPAPDRLQISRLNLDAPIEPVGLVPSAAADGVYEWAVPDRRAAGWLNGSAPFGAAGNTVLDGHHNMAGEVFRDLWTLQPGDEIVLWAGASARDYHVTEVLILPERDQPPAVRLANARYIQPTADERLTLITCWPYEDNSHRAVVVAQAGAR